MTRNPIDVTETDGNGYKRYLSNYSETISADIGSLYKEPKAPTLWRDMTPEEKGALLLAHHEGKGIESSRNGTGWAIDGRVGYCGAVYFRIKSQPKVEVVTMSGHLFNNEWYFETHREDVRHTHRITFNIIDGKPDAASIKMDDLK